MYLRERSRFRRDVLRSSQGFEKKATSAPASTHRSERGELAKNLPIGKQNYDYARDLKLLKMFALISSD